MVIWFWCWIALVFVVYGTYGYFSRLSNLNPDNGWYFAALFAIQACGPWPWVARFTKNMLRDALIFDFGVIIAMYGAFLMMGVGERLKTTHWIGLTVAMIGLILYKVGDAIHGT